MCAVMLILLCCDGSVARQPSQLGPEVSYGGLRYEEGRPQLLGSTYIICLYCRDRWDWPEQCVLFRGYTGLRFLAVLFPLADTWHCLTTDPIKELSPSLLYKPEASQYLSSIQVYME